MIVLHISLATTQRRRLFKSSRRAARACGLLDYSYWPSQQQETRTRLSGAIRLRLLLAQLNRPIDRRAREATGTALLNASAAEWLVGGLFVVASESPSSAQRAWKYAKDQAENQQQQQQQQVERFR